MIEAVGHPKAVETAVDLTAPGGRRVKTIEDAPGSYVKVMSS